MARIIWSSKWETLFKALNSGTSVKDTASFIEVSYSTLCKYLASLSMTNEGKFKSKIHASDNLKDLFENYILKNYPQIPLITEAFGASPSQVQTLMRTFALRKEWDFSNSTAENVAVGRKAELFIKEQPEFRVVADMIKKDSKALYDLVIAGYGAVDVKATKKRLTKSGTHRYKFNIANASAPTKYLFLLGYSEDYSTPEVLLKVPFKEVKGKQSLSVPAEALMESKWAQYVHKVYV